MPAPGLLSWLRTDTWLLLALGPLVAFFGTGFFSGFGTVTAEIYPTSVRAMAQGFTFNIGTPGERCGTVLCGVAGRNSRVWHGVYPPGGCAPARSVDMDLAA